MGMGGGSGGGVKSEMNVTPLVDVVLVLLIIFMVVTPLLTKKLWLHVPKKEEAEETAPPDDHAKPIVLSLARDGTVRLNAQEVARGELPGRVARVLAARGDEVVFFDAA